MKLHQARAVTALGLGLTVLAPGAAGAQEDCLGRVEAIQRTLQTHQGAGMPNLSHLIEAARRYAAEGQIDECLETVEDMESKLQDVAQVPETDQGGVTVQPEPPPPVETHEAPDVRGRREQAVSPVEPPAPERAAGAETATTETLADVPTDELRVDEIVGQPLLNNWGKDLGEIVDLVVARDDPDEVYAVVARDDGVLGTGGEGLVVVSLNRLTVVSQKGIQFPVPAEDSPTLEDMPAYDPAQFQSLTRRQQPTGGGAATGTGG